MLPDDIDMNAGGTKLHLNALTVNLRITSMHLMVGLWGKETNVSLWQVIGNTGKVHRISIGIREFVYCGPNAHDPIHFCDVSDWNIAFHIVNKIAAKRS
jgi:hypothetical protein